MLSNPFRTRVARNVIGLFILSAVVPVLVMAGISFTAVNRQLEDHSSERLAQLARNAGQSVLQQLRATENGLRDVRERVADGLPGEAAARMVPPSVVSLTRAGRDGVRASIKGTPPTYAPPTSEEWQRLSAGDVVLRVAPGNDRHLSLAIAMEPDDAETDLLWADVLGDSVWSAAQTFASLPTVVDFCVLSAPERPLHCASGSTLFAAGFAAAGTEGLGGAFPYEAEGRRAMVGHWSFYPDARFDAPPWSVLVVEDFSSVYAPLDAFSTVFGLALVLAVLLVVLLSNVQVRRTMEPLAALAEGTQRIASGDLSTPVDVSSRDEFGELATSFNAMAAELGVQFAQFAAAQAVGQAALAAFEKDDVVTAALAEIPSICPSRSWAVLTLDADDERQGTIAWLSDSEPLAATEVALSEEDFRWLRLNSHHGGEPHGDAPGFFAAARRGLGNGPLVAFPHLVKGRLHGATLVELDAGHEDLSIDVARRVRQIANQVAVALDDVRLVNELEELS